MNAGEPEPVVHKGQSIVLKMGEAKKVHVDLLADRKVQVTEE